MINIGKHDNVQQSLDSKSLTAEEKIEMQALSNIHQYSVLDLIGGAAGVLLVQYLFQTFMPSEYIYLWAWGAFLSVFISMVAYYALNHYPHLLSAKQWKALLVFFSLLGGLAWGSLIFFVPGDGVYILVITCMFFAIMGAALGAVGHNFSIFASFASPMAILLAIHLLLLEEGLFVFMAVFTIIYLLITIAIAYRFTQIVRQEALLHMENNLLMQRLDDEKKIAEKANADKSRFLAAASHDLRQPLQAMNLFSEALKQRIKDREQQTLLHKLHTSMEAMDNLLNSLLDLSKLDAGLVRVHQENFLLFPMLQKLEETFQPQVKNKPIALLIDPNLNDTGVIIRSDPVLFENILKNLLSNAIKYTCHGEITIACEKVDDCYAVYIKDTGIGITHDEQSNVFEAFYQVNNKERDRHQGIGLGLSIVKRLCVLLAHELIMQSQLGEGTSFAIHVPAATEISVNHNTVSSYDHLKGRVLVVDDDVVILDGMEVVLSSWGCEVLLAQSLDEALAVVKKHPAIDLMLVDYRLQHQQVGTSIIWGVREFLGKPELPAVIISGDTDPMRMQEMESGGFEVLHKPIKPAQLRALMRSLLNSPG